MRHEFIMTNRKSVAIKQCPWANHFIKVYGGYHCFESQDDYETFFNQK